MANDVSGFMAGVPELMILRLLKNHEMYGYEIVQAIAARTLQVVAPGEGVVYPVLHALEKEGALKSRRNTVNGRSRVYYTLTARGEKRLTMLTDSLEPAERRRRSRAGEKRPCRLKPSPKPC